MGHEIKDSKGNPIPDEVIAHVQRTYGNAAAQVATSIVTSGRGFGYATVEADTGRGPEMCGIVVVALDEPNARLILDILRKLGSVESVDS
jgi:hypothetical protein